MPDDGTFPTASFMRGQLEHGHLWLLPTGHLVFNHMLEAWVQSWTHSSPADLKCELEPPGATYRYSISIFYRFFINPKPETLNPKP